MPERWRSSAARDLARAVRAAGGTVTRSGRGKLTIVGPTGTLTLHEPGEETCRDQRRNSARRKITERTGLQLERT